MRRLLAVLAALSIALVLVGGAGTRSVYVRFKDRTGNVSTAYRDTIRYTPQATERAPRPEDPAHG